MQPCDIETRRREQSGHDATKADDARDPLHRTHTPSEKEAPETGGAPTTSQTDRAKAKTTFDQGQATRATCSANPPVPTT